MGLARHRICRLQRVGLSLTIARNDDGRRNQEEANHGAERCQGHEKHVFATPPLSRRVLKLVNGSACNSSHVTGRLVSMQDKWHTALDALDCLGRGDRCIPSA